MGNTSATGNTFSFLQIMDKHIMEPAARRCRSIHSDGEWGEGFDIDSSLEHTVTEQGGFPIMNWAEGWRRFPNHVVAPSQSTELVPGSLGETVQPFRR